MEKPLVGILMGSESDLPIMEKAAEVLKEMGIPYEMEISSAHRLPEQTAHYAKTAKNAAYLACEILSIKYPAISKKLEGFRSRMRKTLEEKSRELKRKKS